MSAWVVGLALAAGYLINKNVAVMSSKLNDIERDYYSAAEPSTDGATSAEVRRAWANTDFTRYGDMTEDLATSQKLELERKVQSQKDDVALYDAGVAVPPIQGVLMTFDRLGA